MNSTAPLVLLLAALLAAGLAITSTSASRNPDAGGGGIPGDFFGTGGQFNMPGFPGNGNGWGNPGDGYGSGGGGYGAGYGGPSGGYTRGGVVRPSLVCSERGLCYKKKLTCPAKCFTSYSRAGKGYGGGGGGGGCSFDCKKCVAYC
ncbi:hypothetical protein HPP92_018181 [Vanilla planifolia]|uniref:Uncharacterized protein n=1 Tax=Vanilla planifolia TaxID=51239 RepID=A0A835QAH1_VANPL|nr:hypothetical protein HPP92_018770 [Vanilla planifolia]KAG0468853.1 hypothetical protein HPP92_018181 [Vanilla planifolia]